MMSKNGTQLFWPQKYSPLLLLARFSKVQQQKQAGLGMKKMNEKFITIYFPFFTILILIVDLKMKIKIVLNWEY